jgi:hypothetical protein
MNPEPCCPPDEMDRLADLLKKAIAAGQLTVGYYKSNGNSVTTADPETCAVIIEQGEFFQDTLELTLPVDSLMGVMKYEIINRITNPES